MVSLLPLAALLLAALPQKVSVQGLLRNTAGPVDGVYKLTVALYSGETGGPSLFETAALSVVVVDGVFSTTLEGVTSAVARDSAWVGVKVEGEPELPRSPLGAALISLHARDVDCTACVELAAISTSGCAPGQLLVASQNGSVGCADEVPLPLMAKLGTSCPAGSFVTGLGADGTLECSPLTEGGTFAMPTGPGVGLLCDAGHLGAMYVDTSDSSLRMCNGTEFVAIAFLSPGSKLNPAASCKALKSLQSVPKDGLYWVQLGSKPTEVYCDMTTSGGGWMLAGYGYRAVAGGSDVYPLPNAYNGTWEPGSRNGRASVDATSQLGAGVEVALTIRNGGAPVTGNLLSYDLAYTWKHAGAAPVFTLATTTTSCVSVTVSELKSGNSFSALTFADKPQVSCSGHAGGTPFERQFIGFNSTTCYGTCGADPVTSNGYVVWYGDGWDPTTSGGAIDPERAGSFAVWFR